MLSSSIITGKTGDILGAKDDLASVVVSALQKQFKKITVSNLEREDDVISIDKMAEFGMALDYKDKEDYENAEKILKAIVSELPDYRRFKTELSAIEKRIAQYDNTHEKLLSEKRKEPVTYQTFIQMSTAYVSSMNYTKLLEYCRELKVAPPKAPEGSFIKTEEMIDYYTTLAHYSLKDWAEASMSEFNIILKCLFLTCYSINLYV